MNPRVLSIRGTGHKDLVCTLFGLLGARTYASGNERTVMRTNHAGNYGFKLGLTDSFSMIVDLMNMASSSKNLYLTMVCPSPIATSIASLPPNTPRRRLMNS